MNNYEDEDFISALSEEFWRRVPEGSPEQCWEWQGYRGPAGYGILKFRGNSQRAHRISAILHIDKNIKSEDFVCHRCDNPPCVNPNHLFISDTTGNMQDMVNKGRHFMQKQTHCKHGHELTEENVFYDKNGWRHCKPCKVAYEASREERVRAGLASQRKKRPSRSMNKAQMQAIGNLIKVAENVTDENLIEALAKVKDAFSGFDNRLICNGKDEE